MAVVRLAAVAAHFGRDLRLDLQRVAAVLDHARAQAAEVVVLPDGTLGGYLADLRHPAASALPPTLSPDDPVFAELCRLAGPLVLCLGFCERDDSCTTAAGTGERLYNAAVALTGDGVLGRYRKVHQPPAEAAVLSPGDSFRAFDTPVGRMGMMIDYDKTFPEAARTLALDGARMLACLSAWPASITRRATSLSSDRQTRLFDLYDAARAAENQVVLLSSNQTGTLGGLRFLGNAKVVGPGGEVLARTGSKGGLAVAGVDVDAEISRARRVLSHLDERRLDAYAPDLIGSA
jgi:predicted amidohydrolase